MSKRLDYHRIAPTGVKALGGVYGYVDAERAGCRPWSNLSICAVSQINNCAYCLDMHTRELVKKGVKIEKIALVQAWAEAGGIFSARARARGAGLGRDRHPRSPRPVCRMIRFEAARAVFVE